MSKEAHRNFGCGMDPNLEKPEHSFECQVHSWVAYGVSNLQISIIMSSTAHFTMLKSKQGSSLIKVSK